MATSSSAIGMFNQLSAAKTTAQATPSSSVTSDSTSSSSSDAATITSTDFLTLLVTEMKNQDPTASTDPNEYINQLVNVNSLQQLISINDTLDTAYPTTDSQTSNTGVQSASSTASASDTAASGAVTGVKTQTVSGNLSVPAPSSAAERVANALSATH